MATISKRKNPSGGVVYRVQIRINKSGYPPFSQSRTFSSKATAIAWAKKREVEIEENPDILLGINDKRQVYPTLSEAINRYLLEVKDGFGRSKRMGLLFVSRFDIGRKRIDLLRRSDFVEFAQMRRNGGNGVAPVASSTVMLDLQHIRSVLKWAFYSWDLEKASWQELDFACKVLKDNRLISRSAQRDRLPTSQELMNLTTFFYQQWCAPRHTNKIPMHLIMWLAIYSCRRQDELCRLRLVDLNRENKEWVVRDVKNPNGSKGNHLISWIDDNVLMLVDLLLNDSVQKRMKAIKVNNDAFLGIQPKSISAAFTRACKTLGIANLKFHDLRHEGATRLAEDGLTPPQIQKYTLHTSWQHLQRYVNLRRRSERLEFKQAMEQFIN